MFKICNINLESPVFIWGTGRCGSYLLYDIMSLHPSLECLRTHQNREKKGLWGELHWDSKSGIFEPNSGKPIEGFNHFWGPYVTSMTNLDGCYQTTSSLMPEESYIHVKNKYRALASKWIWSWRNPPLRFLDKCPRYIMMIDCISKLFPDARHVFCVRDPRSVVNSILRLMRFTRANAVPPPYPDGFWANMYPAGFENVLGRPLVETVCWQINELINLGLGHKSLLENKLHIIRIEEFFSSPRERVTELIYALQLPVADEVFAQLPDCFPDFSPKWPSKHKDFERSFEISFNSSEFSNFQIFDSLVNQLGYDPKVPGKIVGPLRA